VNVPEWKLRAAVVPAALVIALAVHASAAGRFVERTFMSMLVHELGHAVTAWWCGYGALPGLWKTLIPETRGVVAPVLIAAGNGGLVWLGLKFERRWLIVVGAALGLLQLGGLHLDGEHAHALITFGGDGGGMVLGTLLMAAFCVDPEARIAVSHLRWGLVAIGAVAFVDPFATWWAARADRDVIPFGEIEGVGLSDPSKLTEVYGWSTGQLVARYVTLGVVCLVALTAWVAYATWQAKRAGLVAAEEVIG
jgi:hypothetical protein